MLTNFFTILALVCVFGVREGHFAEPVYKTPCCGKINDVPDVRKKTPDFIESNGFATETHLVTTEDGYIITLHRVLGRQPEFYYNEVKHTHRPAVLIQHGIVGRSDNWFMNGPKSFPFILSDADYDVWLADTRGNSYSRRHLWMSPTNLKYWDFSFHEQGYYDLAATTDYIINATGEDKIFYIGHSRGSTMAYVLLSTRPEYNDKFHLIVGFSPVAYIKNAKSPLLQTAFNTGLTQKLMGLDEPLRLLPLPGLNENVVPLRLKLCQDGSPTQPLCLKFIFVFSGDDYELFNSTLLPLYVSHFPDGGSLKEFLHYIQIAASDKFRPYDYGPKKNLKVYGQYEPPEYNLENITAPVSMFYGPNDFVVSNEDLRRLDSRLRTTVARYQVPFKKFNHMDFLWATKADILVYKPALKLMNSFLKYR